MTWITDAAREISDRFFPPVAGDQSQAVAAVIERHAAAEQRRLELLLARKDSALDVFASPSMWVCWVLNNEDAAERIIQWNGAGPYADPAAFAARERDADEPCDRA